MKFFFNFKIINFENKIKKFREKKLEIVLHKQV